MAHMSKFWLMKSEPGVYSIEDLKKDGNTHWEGVRNYQARNLMRDEMKVGDAVLFYHSNATPTGVAGLARVSREAYPDFTCWDSQSRYFDPKSTESEPRWVMVDIEFVEAFDRIVTLEEIRTEIALSSMPLVNRSRLSVQPVTRKEFEMLVQMGRKG